MEENKNKDQFNELGFLLYDIIHISTAVIILITLFVTKAKVISTDLAIKSEFAITCINEFSEIILGALLIFFAAFIYKNVDEKIEKLAYTFAYVIASIALLLPSISNIVDVIINSGREMILPLIQIIFPLGAMVMFCLALFHIKRKPHLWSKMLITGMAFMLLSACSDILEIIIEPVGGGEFEWLMLVEILALLAPLFPITFGLKDLKKMNLIFSKKKSSENK